MFGNNKEEAENTAKALAKRLGKGWKVRVWENLGWHHAATKGGLSVSSGYDNKYGCMMTDSFDSVGSGCTLYPGTKRFKDPRRAVRETVRAVEPIVKEIMAIYNLAKKECR